MHEIFRTFFSVNSDIPLVIEYEENFWLTELFITVYEYVLTYIAPKAREILKIFSCVAVKRCK